MDLGGYNILNGNKLWKTIATSLYLQTKSKAKFSSLQSSMKPLMNISKSPKATFNLVLIKINITTHSTTYKSKINSLMISLWEVISNSKITSANKKDPSSVGLMTNSLSIRKSPSHFKRKINAKCSGELYVTKLAKIT